MGEYITFLAFLTPPYLAVSSLKARVLTAVRHGHQRRDDPGTARLEGKDTPSS